MIATKVRLETPPPSAAKILKNTAFGAAVGFTKTAKEGQSAVVRALAGTFTLRGSWYQQGNKFGIKVKPAKPTDPSAEVRTMADWIVPHEQGTDKAPSGRHLAVPTEQVRRNKRLIIPRNQRPKGLGAKVFVLQTRKGPVLAQRLKQYARYQGPTLKGGPTRRRKSLGRTALMILYGLEPKARIRKQPTFFPPIQKVADRRLNANVRTEVARALATMK